jgi:hypothetical protein
MELYLIKSKDGLYYRSKGRSGSGESWVQKPERAKIFTTKGPARGVISWWVNNYPQYGAPSLVTLTCIEQKSETVNIKEIQIKKLKTEINKEQRRMASYRWNNDLARAKTLFDELSEKLQQLKK